MKHNVKTISGAGMCWQCFEIVEPNTECPGYTPKHDPDDYEDIADRAMDGGCIDVEGMQGADDEW